MDINALIGSWRIRLATVVLAASFAAAMALRESATVPRTGGTAFLILTVVLGIAAFVAFMHCFRTLHNAWLAFAGALQNVMVTLLFGAVYLLIVPWFYLVSRLFDRGRARRGQPGSHWIPRSTEIDSKYFTRMG